MTKVIHLPSPRAGIRVHLSSLAPTFTPAKTDGIARPQAIENALSVALYCVRCGDTPEAIRKATAKAMRAASMLKQACAESALSGRV